MEYPEAVWVPLTPTGTMSRELVSELNALTRSTAASGGNIGIDRCPQTITNIDNLVIQQAAADANFDQTFQWVPEASGKIDKFFVNIGAHMNVESITGGSATLESITLTITREGGDDVLFERTFPSGIAARTVDEDADLFVVQEPIWGANLRIRAGNPLNIRVQITQVQSGTVVSDVGLVPFFPQQIPSTTGEAMFWGHSGILWFISRDRKDG